MIRVIFLSILCLLNCQLFAAKHKPYVKAKMIGQMGNNMFQIATASALAWKNNARACFPDLNPDSPVTQHMFFRVEHSRQPKKIAFKWHEPSHAYHLIPYYPNMEIIGYFQSEKYFSRYRKGILKLFAPRPDDLEYIETKYAWLLDNNNTVGIQIRDYSIDDPSFPQYGLEYISTAMAHFPESSLFIVSSNNLEFAKQCIPENAQNVIFLENEPSYIDLHLLSKCKHNIITNSSFGWWAAWMNENKHKIVICPSYWFPGINCKDICPKSWIQLNSSYN